MITFFRRLFNSRIGAIFALIFVVMIGLAFALGDVTGSGSFGGIGQGYAAQVGEEKISLSEVQDAVENRLRAEQKQNPTLDRARFVDSGGLDDTLEQLVNRYALAMFGGAYGVAVSEKMVNQEILKIPGAVGSDGKFNQAAFASFLQNLNLTEKMVRDDFRQNFYARQLLSTAAPGAKAPAGMALPYASLDLEKRTGEVAVISASAFIPANLASDAVLTQYYRANSVRYTVPEKRAISYAIFDASVVDGKATPSAEEIAAYYNENTAKYAATQARDISQLVFPTAAAAKAASDKITGDKSISAVAQDLGLSATSSSGITREALTKSASKAVADAVFATAQGGVSAPARGQLGYYVVSVSAIKNITARSLAMVSAEISTELKEQKKIELLGDLTAEIENAFEDGSTLADIAKQQGLKIETTPKLLANGQNPANPSYKPVAEMAQIIPNAFQMDTDGTAQLIEVEQGKRFALVSVADFDEAAPAPLAEIKNIVMQQWAMSEGNKKAKTVAEAVRKAVLGGQSLSAALTAAGATGAKIETISSTRGELNRTAQQGQVPPPLALMFAMKKGTAKSIQAPNDRGWFVVHLNEVVRGDASADVERVDANRKELQTLLSQEYAAQLIAASKKEMGVELNKATIKTLRDSMTGKSQQ